MSHDERPRRSTGMTKKTAGRNVWLPATTVHLDVLIEEAKRDFNTLGTWLLKVGLQEAERRRSARKRIA